MKKFLLKATTLAIGALVASSALAVLNLDATTVTANKYATELVVDGTTGLAVLDGGVTDLNLTAAAGAAPGAGVTVYVRIDLSNGAEFVASPTLAVANGVVVAEGAGTGTLSSGGAGSTFAIFALSPTVGTESIQADGVMTLTNNVAGITVFNQGAVSAQIRVYETLAGATNQNANFLLKDTAARNIITFAEGVTATAAATPITADVAVSPAYTAFTPVVAAGSSPGNLVLAAAANVAKANGDQIAITDVQAANTADLVITGDFSLAQNDVAPLFTGAALNRVFLNAASTCAGASIPATALTATTATFTNITAASLGSHFLCLLPEGTPTIPTATYTGAFNFEPATGYDKADLANVDFGSVRRNGTNLVAPLAQVPGGWTPRLVLVNSGSTARTYSVRAVAETGNTVTTTGALASGTLAANSTTVIALDATLLTFTTNPRAALIITVNGPSSQIDGLYQIVNLTTGSISNSPLTLK